MRIDEGAQLKLEPAANSDLRLLLLDAAGIVVATSAAAGAGGVETITLPIGSPGRFVRVLPQGTIGSGTYRLSFVPTGGAAPHPDRVPDGKFPPNPATRGGGQ